MRTSWPSARTWAQRFLLAASVFVACLAAGEVALGLLGVKRNWRYASGWAADDFFCRYVLRPGVFTTDWGGRFRINSLGTRGPEPDHSYVLCLGDSCTFGTGVKEDSAYPALLDPRPGAVINAGIPGYNSFLGWQWLRHSHILDRHPRLVTIYYGWNDHRKAAAPERVFYYLRRLSRHSRLAGVLLQAQMSIWSEEPNWRRVRWCPVVPIDEFKSNLTRIVHAVREAGATPVLITAPYAKQLLPESAPTDELPRHAEYAEAVRQVARETGAGLVDLEAIMDAPKFGNPSPYFHDFVHLNERGHRLLADLLKPWVACAKNGTCADAAGPARTPEPIRDEESASNISR